MMLLPRATNRHLCGVYFRTALLGTLLLLLSVTAAPRPGFAQSNKGEENGIAHRVARLEAALALLQTNNSQQDAKIAALEAKNAQQDAQIAGLLTVNSQLTAQTTALTSSEARIEALEAKTQNMSLLTDPNTSALTLRFTGVNVQIVDGSGDTVGATNGVGNLIVGYNELRGGGDNRTGSHNLIVGRRNNYSAFGGLVAGRSNSLSGAFASITGGFGNIASGSESVVSGGNANSAIGMAAVVSGGLGNIATGDGCAISGGTSIVLSSFLGWSAGGNGPVGVFHSP